MHDALYVFVIMSWLVHILFGLGVWRGGLVSLPLTSCYFLFPSVFARCLSLCTFVHIFHPGILELRLSTPLFHVHKHVHSRR